MTPPPLKRGYDLIVVGLGAVGSAALMHAARRGLRVLGIDRHDPPHAMGSSHAESRITRRAVGEGPQYLPFVARSHEIWRELEAETGVALLYQPGGYIITPPAETNDDRWGSFVGRTAEVAAQADIPFEIHTPAQVGEHAARLILQGDEAIGFEPTGGIVMCERAVQTQLTVARSSGATTVVDTTVDAVSPRGDGVVVDAGGVEYEADKVLVCTGPWFGELAAPVDAAAVKVTRQAVFWFEVDDPEDFGADRFPFVLWPGLTIAEYSAVFPRGAGARPGLKMMGEQFSQETTPDAVDRQVTTAEADEFYEKLVVPRVSGVRRRVLHSTVCLYTNTADDHFLVDLHPDSENVMVASPCSGHGFKHSTALAEAMVLTLLGDPGPNLGAFARPTR